MLRELVRLGLRSLRRNALRSALSMLGIAIGVAAVIAMVTMGAGVTAQVGADLSRLGTNLLLVRPGAVRPGAGTRSEAPPFTLADVQAIERELPEATAGSWVTSTIASPSRCRSSSRSARIASRLRESRLPVGSSARSSIGSPTIARAIATRCCSPPESSAGVCAARPARPTASRARAARARRAAASGLR